jgi:hypothetical protein
MVAVNLTVEIHCHRPAWAITHSDSRYTDSRYRIYINNDLITERNWIWGNNTFLVENMWLYCTEATDYIVKLDPVVYLAEQANFVIDNFQIVNVPAAYNKINDLKINFNLQ